MFRGVRRGVKIAVLFLAIGLMGGCASSQPQATDAQVQAMMQTLGQRNAPAQTRPAVKFSQNPKIAVHQLNEDKVGLTEALRTTLAAAGLEVVEDQKLADVVLSGTVKYAGDPDDVPSQINDLKRQAQVGGAVSTAAAIGMKMSSPYSMISSGVGLLSSAATKAFKPNRLQGVVVLHVRQGDQLWDVLLDQTIEEPKETADKKLADTLAHNAITQLGG